MAFNTARAALVALSLSTMAMSHEHHMDKIEDGHAVSADPIVRHGQERWRGCKLMFA
jgi:hypothetical protein